MGLKKEARREWGAAARGEKSLAYINVFVTPTHNGTAGGRACLPDMWARPKTIRTVFERGTVGEGREQRNVW